MVWALVSVIAGLSVCIVLQNRQWAQRSKARSTDYEASLNDLVEAIPVAILYCDENDRIAFWNSRYEEFAGPSSRFLRAGLSFRSFLYEVVRDEWVEAAKGKEEEWIEARLAARGLGKGHWENHLGDNRWVQFEDCRTQQGGIVLAGVDISEAKRREAALRLLFDHSPLPKCIWDRQSQRIVDANLAAEEHFGWNRDQLTTMSIFDFVPPDERATVQQSIASASLADNAVARHWRLLKADGSEVLIAPRHQKLPDPQRQLLLTALVDVTQAVHTEQELRDQKAALERASVQAETGSRAKSEFLANMSHEIRTPLNGVIAVADVLAKTRLSSEQIEMITLIRSSGETLNRLLSDILDLARVESGTLTFEARQFHLSQALRDVSGLAAMWAEGKGLILSSEIAKNVDRYVVGDEVRVKQILTNLLSNAVKFTASGSVRLSAEMIAGTETVEVRVEDTGMGFDAEAKDRLFHRFQQADGSITRRFGGSGLGLSICRELVAAMNGEIDCASSPGVGSTFVVRLRLPCVEGASQSEAPQCEVIEQRLRVLLADDHVTNQRVASMVLAQVDAEVTVVDDGEQALQAFMASQFDLVLMDMQMPVRDGLSATTAIRAFEVATGIPRSPVIMLTANAAAEHISASLNAGADLHLAKPFTAGDLLGAVAGLLTPPDDVSEAA